MWKGIATTKASKDEENVYVTRNLLSNPHLLPQHVSISLRDLEDHINQQLSQHKCLMYGRFEFTTRPNQYVGGSRSGSGDDSVTGGDSSGAKASGDQRRPSKNRPVNYNALNKNSVKKSQHRLEQFEEEEEDGEAYDNGEEMFEQEVDELINWTKTI